MPSLLADQVSRARSGFDPSGFLDVRQGNKPAAQMPGILDASHQIAWTVFRFGPKYGEAFSDGQFPIESVDELYKQMIPDLNSTLPMPNPTWKQMAALATKLHGAVLMGHSESGFFPEEAALIDPSGVRGNHLDRDARADPSRPSSSRRWRRSRHSSCSAITWATSAAGRRTGSSRSTAAACWSIS
jgi:hypothetical protein